MIQRKKFLAAAAIMRDKAKWHVQSFSREKMSSAQMCKCNFCSAFSLHLCPCSQQYMTHSYPCSKMCNKVFLTMLYSTCRRSSAHVLYIFVGRGERKKKPSTVDPRKSQTAPTAHQWLPSPPLPSADPAVANHRTKENELPKAIFKSIFASGRSAQSNRADLAAAIWSKELVVEGGGLWFFLLSSLFWRRREGGRS